MIEVWLSVPGYEGFYDVSNHGRIFSRVSKRILQGGTTKDGYCYFAAYKNKQRTNIFVHRAVAMAFIPNPDNYPVVNHKDENPSNNSVTNLEWCSVSYNNTYNNKSKKSCRVNRPVYQYSLDGSLEARYFSVREAGRELGVSSGNIVLCCNQELYTAYDKVFSYDELTPADIASIVAQKQLRASHPNGLEKIVEQCLADGTVIQEYVSAKDAAQANNVNRATMSYWCRTEKETKQGYIWRYKKEGSVVQRPRAAAS